MSLVSEVLRVYSPPARANDFTGVIYNFYLWVFDEVNSLPTDRFGSCDYGTTPESWTVNPLGWMGNTKGYLRRRKMSNSNGKRAIQFYSEAFKARLKLVEWV